MKISNLLIEPSQDMDPRQALYSTLSFESEFGLQDVLIIGYDGDGELFIRSSNQCDAVIAKYAYRMADAMIVESGREK